MAANNFLETYPLYRKLDLKRSGETNSDLRIFDGGLLSTPVHMTCYNCNTDRTFNLISSDRVWITTKKESFPAGNGFRTVEATVNYVSIFRCAACKSFERNFSVLHHIENKTLEKIGQYPSWEIAVDRELGFTLGSDKGLYKKGLICESQGYGVAAYAYYRQIVENRIDGLLEDVATLLSGEDLAHYKRALERVKEEPIAASKIDLVKELLPSSLRPDGMNPLGILYSALSKGIHDQTDDQCLELASEIKQVILFLLKTIALERKEKQNFTSNMRRLLEKRNSRT